MHRNPTVMTHDFSKIPGPEIQRSRFDRSCGYKTTFDAGYLIPFYLDEVLPGDTFSVEPTLWARLATPLYPLMDNMYLDTQFFFVPSRLVWDNWQRFNGEQIDPGDSTDFLVPHLDYTTGPLNTGGFAANSIYDYFGLPTEVTTNNSVENTSGMARINSLPFRAYNLIWNEWYRDENMQDSVPVPRDDGPDDTDDFVLLRRGKRHDYFTSCLPFAQKGPAVTIPLTGEAPVIGTGKALGLWAGAHSVSPFGLSTGASGSAAAFYTTASATPWGTDISGSFPNGVDAARITVGVTDVASWSGLKADLNVAAATTINALRQAFQIQRLFERDARGGTRYTEILRAHFGVVSPDARLQRPEYLGGGSAPINIQPIPQTSSTASQPTPQGNLASYGTVLNHGAGFTKSFVEHGYIIGLCSVRADLTYQQGLARMWSRRTRFDFFWPALAHLGEQAVLRQEIYATGNEASDGTVFGYQERFAEYRYKPSQITGEFRSNFAQTLDGWHLSQYFSSAPTLSPTFIVENPPVDRVIAVPSSPHFLLDTFVRNYTTRPMPMYSVPGLIDHF